MPADPSQGTGPGGGPRPAVGSSPRYDEGDHDSALLDLIGDARFVLIGEASHGTHEFYRERAEHHQAADRGEGLHRGRGRGRLARRLPRQPLRARARATTPTPSDALARLPALPDLDVAQRRRARLRRLAARRTTMRSAASARGSASTGSTSTACTRRSRPCSATSTSVDPDAAPARPRALRLLRPLRRRPAGLRLRDRARPRRAAARTRSSPARRAAAARAPSSLRRDGRRRRGRALLRRAERAARRRTPRSTTASMFRGRVSSWNLRDTHMADTLDALVDAPRSPARRAGENRRLGAQLAPRRRPRDRDGRAAGELNVGQLVPRAPRPRRRARRLHHLSRAPSPRPPTGTSPAERKRVRPALRRQLRGAVPRRRRAGASCCRCATRRGGRGAARSRGSSARSA